MHIYKNIFTVKNGKILSISTVRSFQRYAYKKKLVHRIYELKLMKMSWKELKKKEELVVRKSNKFTGE